MNVYLQTFFNQIKNIFNEPLFLLDDEFRICDLNNSAKELTLNFSDINGKNFFSLPLQLANEDYDLFLEKLHIFKQYTGELLLKSDFNQPLSSYRFTIKLIKSEGEPRFYYLLKIFSDKNSFKNGTSEIDENELRLFAIHLQNVREEERAKIARELHDEIGQLLTILKLDLQSILTNPLPKEINDRLKNSLTILDETINITRKIISELRLAILDHLGLVSAIEHLIEEFKEKTKIVVHAELDHNIKLNQTDAVHLFRICQELLTNVRKHSNANLVKLELKKENEKLKIKISDNGRGFDPSCLKTNTGFGLLGIRERVYILNGEFNLETSEGKGTSITILIPIKDENTNS
ncbi:MAG: sensor histidine kinase [Ignavibacteria bacterium]|nr:sensor histidine kinase [Ignavibacteria bacterium]